MTAIDLDQPMVNIAYNEIDELAVTDISDTTELLILSGNIIRRYNFLHNFPNLQLLQLDNCELSSFRQLKYINNHPNLRFLILRSNNLQNFDDFFQLPSLELLDVQNNPIAFDFNFATTLKSIKKVFFAAILQKNQISSSRINSLDLLYQVFLRKATRQENIIFAKNGFCELSNLRFTIDSRYQLKIQRLSQQQKIRNSEVRINYFSIVSGVEVVNFRQKICQLKDLQQTTPLIVQSDFDIPAHIYPTEAVQEQILSQKLLKIRENVLLQRNSNFNCIVIDIEGFEVVFLFNKYGHKALDFDREFDFIDKTIGLMKQGAAVYPEDIEFPLASPVKVKKQAVNDLIDLPVVGSKCDPNSNEAETLTDLTIELQRSLKTSPKLQKRSPMAQLNQRQSPETIFNDELSDLTVDMPTRGGVESLKFDNQEQVNITSLFPRSGLAQQARFSPYQINQQQLNSRFSPYQSNQQPQQVQQFRSVLAHSQVDPQTLREQLQTQFKGEFKLNQSISVTPTHNIRSIEYFTTEKTYTQLLNDVSSMLGFSDQIQDQDLEQILFLSMQRANNLKLIQEKSDHCFYLDVHVEGQKFAVKLYLQSQGSKLASESLKLGADSVDRYVLANLKYVDGTEVLIINQSPVEFIPEFKGVVLKLNGQQLTADVQQLVNGKAKTFKGFQLLYSFFFNGRLLKETHEDSISVEEVKKEGVFTVKVQYRSASAKIIELESGDVYYSPN